MRFLVQIKKKNYRFEFVLIVCPLQPFLLQLAVHINTECPLLEVPCKFVEAGCAFKV